MEIARNNIEEWSGKLKALNELNKSPSDAAPRQLTGDCKIRIRK
jgi:hypothetical protein